MNEDENERVASSSGREIRRQLTGLYKDLHLGDVLKSSKIV